MADNLLPCPNPWCDSGVQPMSFAMRGGFHQVICGCDFKGPRKATKEESEAAWNRRPAPTEADTSLQKVQTTPPDMEAVAWREKVAEAYIAGAMSVHEYWTENPGEAPSGDPEFDEAAHDYAYAALAVIPTEGLGSSAEGADTHRVAETAVVAEKESDQ